MLLLRYCAATRSCGLSQGLLNLWNRKLCCCFTHVHPQLGLFLVTGRVSENVITACTSQHAYLSMQQTPTAFSTVGIMNRTSCTILKDQAVGCCGSTIICCKTSYGLPFEICSQLLKLCVRLEDTDCKACTPLHFSDFCDRLQ